MIFPYLLNEIEDSLNRILDRTKIPQACNQVISLIPGTALTKQPFHNIITGTDISKQNSTEAAKANEITISLSIMLP